MKLMIRNSLNLRPFNTILQVYDDFTFTRLMSLHLITHMFKIQMC